MDRAARLSADVVATIHLGFVAYVLVGGFLAWRWPRSLAVHVPVVCWAVVIVAVGPPCPLTGLQDWLRARAGLPPLRGGFIDQYVEGVFFPAAFTPAVQAGTAVTILLSWGACWKRHGPGPVAHG